MATAATHLARAASDRELARSLRTQGHFNWAVTVMFYSCVHEIGALFTELGIDTEALTHSETAFKLDRHFPGIAARYLSLQGMSRRARYFPAHQADNDTCRRAFNLGDEIAGFGTRVRSGEVRPIGLS